MCVIGQAHRLRVVAIVFGPERAIGGDADLGGFLGVEFAQLHASPVEVQAATFSSTCSGRM